MITKRFFVLLILCTAFIGLGVAHVAAQDEEPAACAQIVQDAMTQMSSVCAGSGLGQICIANPGVDSTFAEEVDGNFFTQPGDVADLSLIKSFTTSPINLDDETWGLAIFNSSANLPLDLINSTHAKGVIYMALGGVEVSEATPLENQIIPLEQGISMSTVATADLRESPTEVDGTFNNVMSRIPAESTVSADAVTQDHAWVRVVFEDNAGWIRSSVLPDSADLSALVEIGPNDFAPMQSINITQNGDNGDCSGTYQGVVIQGPNSTPVDLVLNGIPVQIHSTVFVIPLPGNRIRIFTFAGVAILYPTDPARRTIVPPGFYADVDLGTGQIVTPNPFDSTNIAPIGPPFLIRFLNFLSRFYPTNLVNYSPEELGIQEPSGISAELFITYVNVQRINIVKVFCDAGIIPAVVCHVYGY